MAKNNKLTPIARPPDDYVPSWSSAYAVKNAAGGTLFTGAGSTKEPKQGPKQGTILTNSSALHGEPGHVHQSGDDWGMETDDFWNDYFGTDLANMNPHETVTTTTPVTTTTNTGGTGDTPNPLGSNTTLGSNPTLITTTTDTGNPNPALVSGIKADTDKGPPKLPEESNDPNWSSDYTDSGVPGADLDGEDEPPEPGEPGHLDWYKKRQRRGGHTSRLAGGANPNAMRRVIRAKRTLISGAR